MSGYKTNSGDNLKRQWGIPAVQVRYPKDGTWFMPLERFPGALCDPNGYIVFQNEQEYQLSRYLEIGTTSECPWRRVESARLCSGSSQFFAAGLTSLSREALADHHCMV
jgi:hypothetical protein